MHDMVADYRVEERSQRFSEEDSEAMWFLPHRPVTHPLKPVKVKVHYLQLNQVRHLL